MLKIISHHCIDEYSLDTSILMVYIESMNKLINECQFCKNRFCYHRIVREQEPKYDEVYCNKHINEAEEEADKVLGNPGHMRTHISGTGIQKRGVKILKIIKDDI